MDKCIIKKKKNGVCLLDGLPDFPVYYTYVSQLTFNISDSCKMLKTNVMFQFASTLKQDCMFFILLQEIFQTTRLYEAQ